jgi:adhesin transport system outer membrane protein
MRFKFTVLSLAAALLCATGASAQTDPQASLRSAVQKAINSNPEVTARFNAYRSAADAVDIARSGYYPRLDLNASAGRDRDTISGRTPEEQSLTRTGYSLTLSQLLWDGMATQKDIGRLGHDRLSRYFEVLDVTEQTALEAARAYYDVLRFRRLVQLAEDNFVQHQGAYNQIQSRFKAGVGRGVDLEQAGARLALAESNLNTEAANLHDVAARYQRVVGEPPPAALTLPTAFKSVPASAAEASDIAIRRNPAVSASIENLRSARDLATVRETAFQPKVEARLRSGRGKNFDGVRDQDRDATAEIVLNWNLFNGGADRARMRQQANVVNQAADLRDKACRDVRQTVAIAYNDTRKLVDQLVFLDRNTLAISKARDAYRQQFDIGQRSLLDLLNSENELYTAQRSYANAEYDLAIAYLRTHTAMNQLSVQLGLARGTDMPQAPSEFDGWGVDGDGPLRCPSAPVEMMPVDTAALGQRATAMNASIAVPAPATTVLARPLPATGKAAAAPLAAGSAVQQRLQEWAQAWSAKDTERYLGFYAPDFAPAQGVNQAAWKARRRASLGKAGPIGVTIENIQTRELSVDTVETRFTQTYRSANFNDSGTKVLVWMRLRNGHWFIAKESNR